MEDVNFGAVFLEEMRKSRLSEEEKTGLKMRARDFLKFLFMGLQKRMVGAFSLLKKIKHFSLPEFLSRKFQPGDFPRPFFEQNSVMLVEIEEKCREIQKRHWNERTNTSAFWSEVHNTTDATGGYPFRILSEGVLKMLVLPISNAEVERSFSQVSIIKDKRRNRMETELLLSVMYCRFGLRRVESKLSSWMPPASICKYTSEIYS